MEKEELSSKRNTVSIKVDIDAESDESYSDSESVGLQIDISEVDYFDNTNKLGKQSVEPPAFLNEMAEELERKLETKAAKSNLTATNVKNIIKQVMTHETVVEMCNQKLINNDSSFTFSFEPKFTRSKAKELAIKLPDIPLPQKNANPEIQALVQEEILEDSSDEEYNPEQDQNKDIDELIDEEKDVEYSEESDFDSQPSTPATPYTSMEMPQTPEVQYDEEGIFKIPPLIPNTTEPTEEESIGHRTRSKLSLEETPMELIDQLGAMVAPDFSLDMCYGDQEMDEYSNFLNELYFAPPPREVNDPDDPINDPEYVAEIDIDLDSLYEDEFKKGRDVEIPRKEVKNLVADLSEFADQFVESYNTNHNDITANEEEEEKQVQKVSKKKKTPDNSFTSPNTVLSITILGEPPIPYEIHTTSFQFTEVQRQLLSVQMSQHIQFAAQQFLMTYKHPVLHEKSEIPKKFLHDIDDAKSSSQVPNSAFNAPNLEDAMELIDDWVSKLSDPTFLEEYTNWLKVEKETAITLANSKRKYSMKFHYELIKVMCESKALMHPHLLPEIFAHSTAAKKDYLRSEEHLIAIGLEEYLPIIRKKQKKFNKENFILADALQEVMKNKTPIRNVKGMLEFVKKRRRSKVEGINPIKHYFTTGSAPGVKHRILDKYEAIPPKEQCNLLSHRWRCYVENLKNGSLKELLSSSNSQSKKFTEDDDDNSFFSPYLERVPMPIPPADHELRNPIVNMMRRMSTLIASQKSDTNSRTSKTNRCKTRSAQSKANEIESDAETDQSAKTDEVEVDKPRPHRLRMTSPRLARIKSVQNMKLLAQNVPSKSSSSASSVTENYEKNDDDTSSSVKGDNEDEIAALMEASTTIKKSTTNRKKTKQARELENLKKLSEAEKNINKDERATKFASSFMQKVHDTLESKDPELLKTIIKILIDYSEKLENLNQTNNDYFSNKASSSASNSDKVQNIEDACTEKDKLSISLYKEMYEKLREHQDLCSDLLLFLTPSQAAMIDLSVEYTMLEKMNHFVNVFQCYFAKQPSRIEKIMQAITQIAMDPYVTQESAQATMGAALKGQPHIMDLFLQTLPSAKPPESLCADHMFENLLCPVGPHDKNKTYEEDSRELYENIDMPVSTLQEDPYGGDGCKCDCHNWIDDSKSKGINEHCPSCAMKKFLNGRVYLQTSEGLRPAKISFQGGEDEKLENISRVSLKNREERIIPCQPAKKRRKTTKRDSISEDSNPKPSSSKGSPSKSNDDNDKTTTKLKKSVKSPPKTIDQKKPAKSQTVGVKSKREKKNEKKDLKSEQKTDDEQNDFTSMADQIEEAIVNSNKFGEISTDSHEDDNTTSPEKLNASSTSNEKVVSSDSDSSPNLEPETPPVSMPWTKQEDKILLEHVRKEYSVKSFQTISSTLKNRSVEEVKERCEYLLQLIKKMT